MDGWMDDELHGCVIVCVWMHAQVILNLGVGNQEEKKNCLTQSRGKEAGV